MSSKIRNANEFFMSHGSEQFYRNIHYKFIYTSGVRKVAETTESFWFLDVIDSYQPELKKHEFQSWILRRNVTLDELGTIIASTDSFKVSCTDGNNNILKEQHIEFSDFPYDLYEVWKEGDTLLLPSEH